MIVVKIGGSLYHSACLTDWLTAIAKIMQTAVIVPGGGPFADQVRQAGKKWALSSSCAHDMAVLAMQQYGHMLVGLNSNLQLVKSCRDVQNKGSASNAMVWAPYEDIVHASDIEKNWQTTSDSLALWLAIKLSADRLCLVKSAEVDGLSMQQIIEYEIVDHNFQTLLPRYAGQVHFYHASQGAEIFAGIRL